MLTRAAFERIAPCGGIRQLIAAEQHAQQCRHRAPDLPRRDLLVERIDAGRPVAESGKAERPRQVGQQIIGRHRAATEAWPGHNRRHLSAGSRTATCASPRRPAPRADAAETFLRRCSRAMGVAWRGTRPSAFTCRAASGSTQGSTGAQPCGLPLRDLEPLRRIGIAGAHHEAGRGDLLRCDRRLSARRRRQLAGRLPRDDVERAMHRPPQLQQAALRGRHPVFLLPVEQGRIVLAARCSHRPGIARRTPHPGNGGSQPCASPARTRAAAPPHHGLRERSPYVARPRRIARAHDRVGDHRVALHDAAELRHRGIHRDGGRVDGQ